METNRQNNYEESMIFTKEVIDKIKEALENHKALSIARFGHIEIAYMGMEYFPNWLELLKPYSSYSGVTVSPSTIKNDLINALRNTDILGLHGYWGATWEDKETAKLTKELFKYLAFKPETVCYAFINHEMIANDYFWKCLKDKKVALVGRRAAEAAVALRARGINVTYTTTLEGYEEIDKVYKELSNLEEWDIALISAGIPASILSPKLAKKTNKVVIDFGHAMDKIVEGENFDYEKVLRDWNNTSTHELLVSIVMGVYNGEKYLKEAIDSALSQTYSNIELIIVNDGSNDSTKSILDAITDSRVKVIHFEKNQGVAIALNTGIMHARGSWISILNADDNQFPTKLEEQVKYIHDHPELICVGTLIKCIPGDPYVLKSMLSVEEDYKNSYKTKEEIKRGIYWGCPLTHSSVIFQKKAFWDVGGYNKDFRYACDYDLWLRLLEKGDIGNVPKVLLEYRIYTESLSHKSKEATINEVQIASSRAINRLLKRNKVENPKVVVMGPLKGCQNYVNVIAPKSELKVDYLIYENWSLEISKAIKYLKTGKINAIIVLDGYYKKIILNALKSKDLRLNKQVFNLYNILE